MKELSNLELEQVGGGYTITWTPYQDNSNVVTNAVAGIFRSITPLIAPSSGGSISVPFGGGGIRGDIPDSYIVPFKTTMA